MTDSGPGDCECGCVNTFSSKSADDDLRRYREKGADGTTRTLVRAIRDRGIEGGTLLDVGGGVGVIQWELLAGGVSDVQSVDATEAYVDAVRREAERRGLADRVTARLGTLESVADSVAPADIVTLDRVLCCDPDVNALLGAVSARARRIVGLVYPRDTWWNRVAARAMDAWGWITRDPMRWHLHAEGTIDALLRSAGFEQRFSDRTLIWNVHVYERAGSAEHRIDPGWGPGISSGG